MQPPPGPAQFRLSPLHATGSGLIALFLIWSLAQALPLRLLDPLWLHQLIFNCVNNAALALIGLCLLRLASQLESEPDPWQRWERLASQFASIAAVIYLLFIPLDLSASWRQLDAMSEARQVQATRVNRLHQQMLNTIDAATTAPQLASQLAALNGPQLNPQDLGLPLPALKQELRRSIDRTHQDLVRNIQQTNPRTIPSMVQEGFRLTLSCLVIATCFFSLTADPNSDLSTLERLVFGLQQASRKRLERRREELEQREQRELELQELEDQDPSPMPMAQNLEPGSPSRLRRRSLEAETDEYVRRMLAEDEDAPTS